MPRSSKAMTGWAFRMMQGMFAVMDVFGFAKRRFETLPVEKGMTVLDVGCGPGRYTIPAARKVGPGAHVYAVDIQPLAVEAVKKKAARDGLGNVEAILLEGTQLPLPDNAVDCALMIDVFHQVDDRSTLVHELHRVLRPGGILFVVPDHMSAEETGAEITASGLFRTEELEPKALLFHPV